MELWRFRIGFSKPERDASASNRDESRAEGEEHPSQEHKLSARDMKHNFAIQAIEKSNGALGGEYLCHCVRCEWTFEVNVERSTIAALDNFGEPLVGDEATKRIETFANGPCPAFSHFPEYEEARREHSAGRHRFHNVRHLFGLD
jgi:hypothetical protein